MWKVVYGSGLQADQSVKRSLHGGVLCSNEAFGDPSPGSLKSCSVRFSAGFTAPNNIAVGKPATQGPVTGHGLSHSAAAAVDGSTTSLFSAGSCTRTEAPSGWSGFHWWMVDLERSRSIEAVTVHNRGDCCSDRLGPFQVYVRTLTLVLVLALVLTRTPVIILTLTFCRST